MKNRLLRKPRLSNVARETKRRETTTAATARARILPRASGDIISRLDATRTSRGSPSSSIEKERTECRERLDRDRFYRFYRFYRDRPLLKIKNASTNIRGGYLSRPRRRSKRITRMPTKPAMIRTKSSMIHKRRKKTVHGVKILTDATRRARELKRHQDFF